MQVVDKKIEEIRGKGGVMRRGERRRLYRYLIRPHS